MYNINNVLEVNKRYVFLHFEDGSQERESTKLEDIKTLYIDLTNEMNFIEKMGKEIMQESDNLSKMIEELDTIIESQTNKINNSDDPLDKRGLSERCFTLKNNEKKRYDLSMNRNGVNMMHSRVSDKYWKYYKLKNQCETVIKDI